MRRLPLSVVTCLLLMLLVSGKQQLPSQSKDVQDLLLELLRPHSSTTENDVTDFWLEREAKDWLEWYNGEYLRYMARVSLAEYTYETNITDHNEQQFSEVEATASAWMAGQVSRAEEFKNRIGQYEDPDVERMLKLIILAKDSSQDEELNKKISKLRNSMTEIYGTAKPDGYPLSHHSDVMATSRDWDELIHAWKVWRDETGPKIRSLFTDYVTERNEMSKANGWSDVGEYWRVMDFEEDNVEESMDKLYGDILPLYKELHSYVRRKLIDFYQGHSIDPKGPIPAHVLGNMWAQTWSDIFDIVKPYPDCEEADPTTQLEEQQYTPLDMFKLSEEFFTSLSLDKMTETFWNKSMIERPDDGREVVCHASASDLFEAGDFRIKMCTQTTSEDLFTIHHEMGHIEYYMQYARQPPLYRKGANAAFHEAIGDTIALSVRTPRHLRTVGLLGDVSTADSKCSDGEPSESDLNFLMMTALQKVAFLPYGYLLDKYRWDVFRTHINESNYNTAWWSMRNEIQGISAPIDRSEEDFDPGAKYHVAAHVPYSRYFFAHIGQFQFLKAMCDAAGHQGPLYKCDVYRSQPAGRLLKSMLEMGCSKPWPEAMSIMTGQRDFKADALFEYFQPLHTWLQKENQGEHKGWASL